MAAEQDRNVLGMDQELTDLERLEKWCMDEITLMEQTIERKFVSKHRKLRLQCQIIGIEKVLAQITKLK